jgi:hypothetical protein
VLVDLRLKPFKRFRVQLLPQYLVGCLTEIFRLDGMKILDLQSLGYICQHLRCTDILRHVKGPDISFDESQIEEKSGSAYRQLLSIHGDAVLEHHPFDFGAMSTQGRHQQGHDDQGRQLALWLFHGFAFR